MARTTTDWSTVRAARTAWRQADAEITRVATVQGELEALAAAAERDTPGEPAAVLSALERLGQTSTETVEQRREALSYAAEPVFDGQDAIAAFASSSAIGSSVDAVVRALRAFLDGGEFQPVITAVTAVVERPATGWTVEARTDLTDLSRLFERVTDAAIAVRDRRVTQLNDALASTYQTAGDPISKLQEQPIALLPVRLETRFVDPEDGVGVEEPTLRVRVFHDQLHVDSHEPQLTRAEERWAENFWAMVWLAAHPDPASVQTEASADRVRGHLGSERLQKLVADVDLAGFSEEWRPRYDELKERAWRQVLDRYDRERGAYIVHAMAPDEEIANRLLAGPPKPPEPYDGPLIELPPGFGGQDESDDSEPWTLEDIREGNVRIDHAGETTIDEGALLDAEGGYPSWYDADSDQSATDALYERQLESAAEAFEEEPLSFPEVPRRSGQWTRAARAALLPDRFVAVFEWTDEDDNQRRYVQAGDPVAEPLQIGPDVEPEASDAESEQDDGDSAAPPGLEWLTDFAEAERVGMALSVPLSKFPGLQESLDRVVVVGVKASLSANETPDALRDLLEAHHYTDGLSFVEQGTPTNATRESDAVAGDDALTSLPVELEGPLVTTGDKSDGDLLARALAVEDPDEERPHVFEHVAGADATAQRDARHVNTALWPATMGYTLTHLMVSNAYTDNPSIWGDAGDPKVPKSKWYSGLDEPLAWLDTYRRHFVRYVRGEGPLPTMRVGRQPYGVLPAGAIQPEPSTAYIPPGIEEKLANGTLTLSDAVVETKIPLEHFVEGIDPDILLSAGGDPGDLYRAGMDAGRLAQSVEIPTLRSAGVPGRDLVAAGVDSDRLRAGGYDSKTVAAASDAAKSGDKSGQQRAKAARGYSFPVSEPADIAEREQYSFPFDPAVPLDERLHAPPSLDDLSEDGSRDDKSETDGGTATVDRRRTTGRDNELPAHLSKYIRRFRKAWEEGAEKLPEELDEDALVETLKREAVSSVAYRNNEYRAIETGGDDPSPWSFALEGLIEDSKQELIEDLRWADLDDLDPRLAYLGELSVADPEVITPLDAVDMQVERFVRILRDLPVGELAKLSWDLKPEVLPIDPSALDLTQAEWDEKDEDAQRRTIVRSIDQSEDPYGLYNDLLTFDEKTEESVRGEASRDRLLSMVQLQASYGEPGLLSTLVRLLTHYGLLHTYLNARTRLGVAYGDPPQLGPDPDSYRPLGRTMFDELYDNAPQSLMAHPDLTGGESYAEALRLAAADYETTTSIDPPMSEYTDSLAYLGKMDPETLSEQLFSVLDLSNHRLDAWWSSLATKRLFELRTVQGQFGDEQRYLNWVTGEHRDAQPDGGEDDAKRPDDGAKSRTATTTDSDRVRGSVSPELLWTLARDGGSAGPTVSKDDVTAVGNASTGTAVSIDAPTLGAGSLDASEVLRPDGRAAVDPSKLGDIVLTPPPGLYVGAYGYVENLRRTDRGAAATPEYIHAPSEQQATTAALLRAGYRAFADGDGGDAMAVDLSADRIREGLRLLRGVRRGQPLGELLGYRLERRLREVTVEQFPDPPVGSDASNSQSDGNLMKYLPALRTLFPSDPGRPGAGGTPRDEKEAALARQDVVDGYRLVREWEDFRSGDSEKTYPSLDGVRGLPGQTTDNGEALQGVVAELIDAVDAVGDLLTAESVHQLGQGNFAAAAGSIDALARGQPLPDPTVVDIPRTETGISTRQFLLVDPKENGASAVDTGHPRARAEPALETWLDDLLVPLSSVGCVGHFEWTETTTDAVTGEETEQTQTETVSTTLDGLDLSALDVLSIAHEGTTGEQTELDERLGYHFRRTRPDTVPADATLAIDPSDPGTSPLAVVDLFELTSTLRDLLSDARPLEAADLLHPDDQRMPESADLQQTAGTLAGRADVASTQLAAVEAALDERLDILVPDEGQRADLVAAAETGTSTPPTTGEDGQAPTVPAVTAHVDALAAAVEALDESVDHATIASVTASLNSSGLRTELATLREEIPAGPTELGEVPETLRVSPEPNQLIRGSIRSDSEESDPTLTPGDIQSLSDPTPPGSPDPTLSPSVPDVGTVDLGTAPNIDLSALPSATVEVEIWGHDGETWFDDSTTVDAEGDGTFTATFDFSGVAPGTPFTIGATVQGQTVYTARGRVVGASTPELDPVGTLESSPNLRALLWLARRRDALDVADDIAAEVADALAAIDWATVASERAQMDTGGVLTAADLTAVDALDGLQTISMADLDTALSTVLSAVEGTEVVGAFGTDEAAATPADGTIRFSATAHSHRLRAALNYASTNPAAAVNDVDPALWAYGPGVALALDSGVSNPAGAAAALEGLLSMSGQAVTGLSAVVPAAHSMIRDLTAWLYHPAEFDGTHSSLSNRLTMLAGDLSELDYLDDVLAGLPRADSETPRDALATHLQEVAAVVATGPHSVPSASSTTATFDQRQTASSQTLTSTTQTLTTRVSAALAGEPFEESFRNGVLEPLRSTLVEASNVGIYAATPLSADGGTPQDENTLLGQTLAVRAAVEKRLRAEQAIVDARAGTTVPPAQAIEDGVDRLHALFGENFTVLPPFTPANADELTSTFGDSGLLPDGATFAPETWLQRMAHVRDRPAAFREAYSYAEALAGDLKRTLAVGQLPYREGDVWAGVEPPHRGDTELTPGTLSLVAGLGPDASATDVGGRVAGLFIDEWVDSVPAESETTGVAIEYDDPGARAPQSILLAVPPDDGQWTLSDLTRTVTETMAYARLRTVDMGDIDRLDGMLPGLFFANNESAKPRTPSIDFRMLQRYDHELVASILLETIYAIPYNPDDESGGEGE